jgi:hypothetical protein
MPVPTKTEGKRFQFFPTDEAEAIHKSSTILNRRRAIINPALIPLGTYPVNSTETSIVGPVRNPIYPGTAAYDALYENVSNIYTLWCAYELFSIRLLSTVQQTDASTIFASSTSLSFPRLGTYRLT